MQMNDKELDRYKQLYSEIEAEITSTQERIIQLRKELKMAREVRQHRQQYDAMAKVWVMSSDVHVELELTRMFPLWITHYMYMYDQEQNEKCLFIHYWYDE